MIKGIEFDFDIYNSSTLIFNIDNKHLFNNHDWSSQLRVASEKRVPTVQVLSLGTPSTQMMYSFGSLATGNRGNGQNLCARGERSSLLGHLETAQIIRNDHD